MEFDFSWQEHKIAIEVQGGINCRTRRSGHVSIDGMHRDIYKLALAQSQGWILIQFPPIWITSEIDWQKTARRILLDCFELRGIKLVPQK